MTSYPYKPLDLSKNEIRILKILDSTALQQPELIHCSLQHVSLDDVHPKFKAFKDGMESTFKQPMKGDYAIKCWMLPDSEPSTPGPAAVREQDPEMSDNLHWHTQPSIAHWRYEADNSDEARKHLVETLSIDASTLPPRPQPRFLQRRSETVSPRPFKPQTFKIKPRFTWGDYESISYCWESDIREKEVIVDGVLVRVPKNLEFLLQKLQHLPEASSGMGFWVDGLCIDQDNTLEKNHQVHLMQHIYSQSFATIVWLGNSCEGSNRAMDLMAQIAEVRTENEDELDVDPWISRLPWEDVYAVLTRSYWKRMWIIQELALNTHMTLFLCGERQLPRDAILSTCLFCFDSHARAISEALANQRADAQTRSAVPEYDTWQTANDVFNLFQLEGGGLVSQRPRLENILDLARKANVKDPRDKVYGILGLLPPSLSSKIKPNYSLSKGQVYVHFATAFLESCESLDEILSWCAYVPNISLTSRVSDRLWPFTSRIADWRRPYTLLSAHMVEDMLPSWVPDWTKPFPRCHLQWLRKSFASGQMRLPYTTIGRELHCRGIRVDSIQSTSFSPAQSRPYRTVSYVEYTSSTQEATYHRYSDMNGLAKALNWTLLMSHPRAMDASVLEVYWIDWEHLDGPNNGADAQIAALWTYAMAEITRKNPDVTFSPWESFDRFRHRNADFTLFGRAFKSFFPNMRSYKTPSLAHATHFPLNYIEQQKGSTQNLTKGHARNVKLAAIGLEGRKLVTTTTGFLGLAPEETQTGDVLAVLIGCNFPVVLRPFGRGFRYIGECYVAGLMRGEAVAALEGGEYQVVDITLR